MKKILIRILSLLFFLQVVSPPALAAQLGLQAPDVEPPTILFDQGKAEIEEGIKTFSATVTDNVGVANVTLYFKGPNDVVFTPREMRRSKTDANVYTVQLTIDPAISKKLEIYLRADDVSGNSIFEGQKFSPLTYTVVPRQEAEEVIPTVTEPSVAAKAEEKEEGMSTMTMILIGLGVAALAGGGGGGGGGPAAPTTGTITITTDIPGN